MIVHELELVKHGFNPIYMPTTFAPMENGDYLLLGADRDENLREIMRHSPRDADAMDRFEHDLTRVLQLLRPLFDKPPPNIFGKSPEDAQDIAWLLGHLGSAEPKVVHDAVRLITGSITDFVDDYFESEIIKAHLAASVHDRHQGRTDVGRLRAGLPDDGDGRARREPRHAGRSTRAATAGSRRCSPGRRRRTALRSGSRRRSTTSSPRTGERWASSSPTAPSSTPTSS